MVIFLLDDDLDPPIKAVFIYNHIQAATQSDDAGSKDISDKQEVRVWNRLGEVVLRA